MITRKLVVSAVAVLSMLFVFIENEARTLEPPLFDKGSVGKIGTHLTALAAEGPSASQGASEGISSRPPLRIVNGTMVVVDLAASRGVDDLVRDLASLGAQSITADGGARSIRSGSHRQPGRLEWTRQFEVGSRVCRHHERGADRQPG